MLRVKYIPPRYPTISTSHGVYLYECGCGRQYSHSEDIKWPPGRRTLLVPERGLGFSKVTTTGALTCAVLSIHKDHRGNVEAQCSECHANAIFTSTELLRACLEGMEQAATRGHWPETPPVHRRQELTCPTCQTPYATAADWRGTILPCTQCEAVVTLFGPIQGVEDLAQSVLLNLV